MKSSDRVDEGRDDLDWLSLGADDVRARRRGGEVCWTGNGGGLGGAFKAGRLQERGEVKRHAEGESPETETGLRLGGGPREGGEPRSVSSGSDLGGEGEVGNEAGGGGGGGVGEGDGVEPGTEVRASQSKRRGLHHDTAGMH